jgi:YD repeat-containing protein
MGSPVRVPIADAHRAAGVDHRHATRPDDKADIGNIVVTGSVQGEGLAEVNEYAGGRLLQFERGGGSAGRQGERDAQDREPDRSDSSAHHYSAPAKLRVRTGRERLTRTAGAGFPGPCEAGLGRNVRRLDRHGRTERLTACDAQGRVLTQRDARVRLHQDLSA